MKVYRLAYKHLSWPRLEVVVVADGDVGLDVIEVVGRMAIQERNEGDSLSRTEPELHAVLVSLELLAADAVIASSP